jgi:hypothetical protein
MTQHSEHNVEQDQEYRLVYEGICAVAGRCDGALQNDGVGFNGQDTAFGRRIASVPFEEWTDSVRWEAARIARTYRVQIESYTGVDVAELGVVKAIAETATSSSAARDTARGYEKAAEAEARREELAAKRWAILTDGRIQLSWDSKDPDCFGVLLTEVKQLPGRRWTGSANVVDVSIYALDFIETHGLRVQGFDPAALRAELSQPVEERKITRPVNVKRDGETKVRISFPYNDELVAAVRSLPGRKYNGGDKTNSADLCPEVIAFADKYNLVLEDGLREAVSALQAVAGAVADQAGLLRQVSRLDDPAKLSEAFLAQLLQACDKVEVA